MWLLLAALFAGKEIISETLETEIPASYWRNKELIDKDRMSGMKEKEFMRNVRNGKYFLPDKPDLRTILPTEYTTEEERIAAIKAWSDYYTDECGKPSLRNIMIINGYGDVADKLDVQPFEYYY